MQDAFIGGFYIGFVVVLAALILVRRVIVQEHERVVLYRKGAFKRVLGPGEHWLVAYGTKRIPVDIRRRLQTIPAQELLTADGIGVKATIVLEYEISDPYASISKVENVQAAIYVAAQLAFRDVVTGKTFDELMQQRAELGTRLTELMQQPALEFGVTAHRMELKDLMLPGDLKRIYAKVAEAKQEGLASLERARGESAALRSLANAAKLLEESPGLWRIRVLEAMQQPNNNTFVIGSDVTGASIQK